MNAPELDARLDAVGQLINTGRWPEAYTQARTNACDARLAQSARVWFQLALVAGLVGRTATRSYAHDNAKRCSDYTDQLEGDFARDQAIILLKKGDTKEALALCQKAQELHRGDGNRSAALLMVCGRIALRQGKARTALDFHRLADKRWKTLGSAADRQWITNNLLHWLQAAVMSWHYAEAWQVLRRLLREEQNPRRKQAAVLSFVGRGPAYRWLLAHR